MKKIFFSLLAIAAIASCAKTEAVYNESDSEIKLAPVTALQTKANVLAAIDGTEYPTAENFDVYGYWKNGDATNYTDGQSFFGGAVEFKNKGNYWGGVQTYYWPKNGTLRFAAYSPSSLDVEHDQVGDTFTKTGYTQPSNTAETYDFLVAPTSAPYTAMTAAENVSVVFEHALSWITLKVKAKDAAASNVFTIKNVTINGISTTADFSASMLGQEMVSPDSWKNWGDENENIEVFKGVQAVTGEATVIENTTAGTLVIPQNTTKVTVVFNQKGVNGTMDMEDMKVELDLVLDKDGEAWKPGYHYTYTLIFGLDEILINPSVDTWEEYVWNENGSQGNLEADNAANVYTSNQLVAAVAKGGKVTLASDIELEEAVTVETDVVLDLNGYALTYTSDIVKHNAMITVNTGSELIVRDGVGTGKISYNYTGAGDPNFGWGSYTIANNGELYVENGTVEIVCALNDATVSHMYSAIHQGGNANSKTVVSGGKVLNANYRSIRINQGSLKIYEGVEIAGQVWMHPFAAGTSLEIRGGEYAPTGADGSSVFVTNNEHDVKMVVTGGSFATKIGTSNATANGVKGSISAGTFADVTGLNANLIAEGYSLAQKGDIWVVVEGEYDTVAEDFDDLSEAVKNGENVILADDFVATSTGSNGYGKTGLSMTKGGVIDGNGNDFASPSSTGTWDSAISTTGGTIKNINIVEGFRGVFIKSGTEKVYLENVTIDGTTYTISCDSASYQGLYAVNCTFNGWTSYAKTIGEVYFYSCSFGEGNGYNYSRPYADTTYENCAFAAGHTVNVRANVVFKNCTLDGVLLTEDNIKDLIAVTSGTVTVL